MLLEAIMASAGSQPCAAEVSSLINQLGDQDYQVREAATEKLTKMGASIRPMLKAKLKEPDPDPEIVDRIEKILMTVGQANPSTFKCATNPVEQVSWDEAVAFCQKASEKTGRKLRLPTEAEWEYACRAGSKARFSFGDDDRQLGDYAWFQANSSNSSHPVGQKKPNAWGLHDMHGNVGEWCLDWHGSYVDAPQKDPAGPRFGQSRAVRGASWVNDPALCRTAYRDVGPPGDRGHIGFRVVVDPE
jgi:formylglycine-generating enzyme required for sulfatase activity